MTYKYTRIACLNISLPLNENFVIKCTKGKSSKQGTNQHIYNQRTSDDEITFGSSYTY